LQSNKQRKSTGSKRLETSASTYQIDDATLRQLFMSYLLADRDKQPEIATVMASILGYSPEEQSLIQETFAADGIGSWFGFTGRKSGGGQRKEPSLTEQFIRFLETESRTIDEQPTLPIPQSPMPTAISVSIADERATTPYTDQPTADTPSELKTILET